MAQPYVGEIRIFAGNFAPSGWLFCDGSLISISENETLFQLIGTTYGGDGESTFALPDMRGRIPIHTGNGTVLGEQQGVETVTLSSSQIPAHSHPMLANSGLASEFAPGNQLFAQPQAVDAYVTSGPSVALNPTSCGSVGGSQPHDNFQPYLCLNFIISLFGIFPSPT